MPLLARVSLIACAIVVCAWFVIGIRQAHGIAGATRIVSSPTRPPASELNRAAADLRSAETLNPDPEVKILQGRLQLLQGHPAQAQQILKRLTRDEPQNLDAWYWLGGLSLSNPAEERVVIARLHELDPLQ